MHAHNSYCFFKPPANAELNEGDRKSRRKRSRQKYRDIDLAILQAEASADIIKSRLSCLHVTFNYEPLPSEVRTVIRSVDAPGLLPSAAIEKMMPAELIPVAMEQPSAFPEGSH